MRQKPNRKNINSNFIKIKEENLDQLEKEFSNDKLQVFSNGETYRGDMVEGLRHGRGIQTWPDGAKYIGEWKLD